MWNIESRKNRNKIERWVKLNIHWRNSNGRLKNTVVGSLINSRVQEIKYAVVERKWKCHVEYCLKFNWKPFHKVAPRSWHEPLDACRCFKGSTLDWPRIGTGGWLAGELQGQLHRQTLGNVHQVDSRHPLHRILRNNIEKTNPLCHVLPEVDR